MKKASNWILLFSTLFNLFGLFYLLSGNMGFTISLPEFNGAEKIEVVDISPSIEVVEVIASSSSLLPTFTSLPPTSTTVSPVTTDTYSPATATPTYAFTPVPGCEGVTQIPQEECIALVMMYNELGGSEWIRSTGWLSTNYPCNWRGIHCENKHVISIELAKNNLVGELPKEIGNFSKIRGLNLDENSLSGPIPAEIGNLRFLIYLLLWDNNLSGYIPEEIGELKYLDDFNISGNAELSGPFPTSIYNIKGLKWLGFHNTSMCELSDESFKLWIGKIDYVGTTDRICAEHELIPTATPTAGPSPTPVPTVEFVPNADNNLIVDDFSTKLDIWEECENCEWRDGSLFFGPFAPVGDSPDQIFYMLCEDCGTHTHYRVSADVTFYDGYGADRTFGVLAGLVPDKTISAATITTAQHAMYETYDIQTDQWIEGGFDKYSVVKPEYATNHIEVSVTPGNGGYSLITMKINGTTVFFKEVQNLRPSQVGLYLGWHSIGVEFDNFEFEVIED